MLLQPNPVLLLPPHPNLTLRRFLKGENENVGDLELFGLELRCLEYKKLCDLGVKENVGGGGFLYIKLLLFPPAPNLVDNDGYWFNASPNLAATSAVLTVVCV